MHLSQTFTNIIEDCFYEWASLHSRISIGHRRNRWIHSWIYIEKIAKLIIILLGLVILFFLYLTTRAIININYAELGTAVAELLGFASQAAAWAVGVVSLLPFMGSFVGGFLLGFKIG